MTSSAFDGAPRRGLETPPVATRQPPPRTPLEDLFSEQFAQWVDDESRGPRGAGFDAAWEQAILDPARHVLGGGGKQLRARLTEACFALGGGSPEQLSPLVAMLVEILHAGSLVIDDIQDNSLRRRGQPTLHHVVGTPLAINTGNLFYCWAFDLLPQIGLPPTAELELFRRMSNTLLRGHHGQGLDLSVRIGELPQHLVATLVQTTTRNKAGALMELAAACGAVAADCDRELAQGLAEFGRELGCGLQMLDDLSGVVNPERRHKAKEDVSLQRPTWNWAWLSRDLSATRFSRLQARLRAARSEREIDSLIDEIADLVRGEGKERVVVYLHEALEAVHGLAALRDSRTATQILSVLRSEIERLEKSYV